ncbi:MAG: SRPBCC family protein [Actinoplanes sp.]
MTNSPTGRLLGKDLVLTRSYRADIEDVWASVTEPDRTARWFGRWRGEAGPGRTVQLQMAYEGDDPPWMDVHIDACEPPRRLAVSTVDEAGAWHLELLLEHAAGRTELRLVHHLTSTEGLGEVGPGWEYYLDMLTAARDETPQPSFDDYYPAMKAHYEGLLP